MEFNYIQQKTEEYGITKDALETARLAFSNSLPMNDTLDICSRHITEENVRDVCSQLFNLISNGVGLPTQAGTAKFLATITKQHGDLIKKYSGKLISKLCTKLGDQSSNLRKLYAITIAHLASISSDKTFEGLLKKLKNLYFTSGTSSSGSTIKIYRHVVGVCILELSLKASRKLSEFHIDCVPLTFFATCDTSNEDTKKLFETVWVELGGHSSDRIFTEEIIELIEESFQSSSWIMRRQGYLVLKKLADRVDKHLSRYAVRILSILFNQLKERRIWNGKEDIFPAIASVSSACKDTIEADDLELENNISLTTQYIVCKVFEESKRSSSSSKEYQRRALSSVGKLLETFCPPLDMFENIYPDLKNLIQSISEQSNAGKTFVSTLLDPLKRAEEEKEASLNAARNKLVQAECFRILGAAWPIQVKTQEKYLKEVLDLFTNELIIANWNTKIKILSAMDIFVSRININIDNQDETLLTSDVAKILLNAIKESINDPKYQIVRETGLKTLYTIVKQLKDTNHAKSHIQQINEILSKQKDETKLQVSQIQSITKLFE